LVSEALNHAWALEPQRLRYLPVGGGAYHWEVDCPRTGRRFVTCDDLDTKAWLGFGRERGTVFDGLTSAYRAAMELRSAGNAFVVSPIPTVSGSPTWRLDDRHSLSVFHFVDGEPGQWGEPVLPSRRQAVLEALVALHGAPPTVNGLRVRHLEVDGREDLDDAMRHLDEAWDGGPLSERARLALSRDSDVVVSLLQELDDLSASSGSEDGLLVVTHGEPHPGNVIHSMAGPMIIDWDTVALARPERDLWMLAEIDIDLIVAYEGTTGYAIDRRALRAWRLAWALTDLAAFSALLRGPHDGNTDTERSLVGLQRIIAGSEPRPYA